MRARETASATPSAGAVPAGEAGTRPAPTARGGEARAGPLAGPLGQATPGDQLVFAGAFSQHARYGWQFAVDTFRSVLPRSPEGVARWLMTRVPGIGPTFARAIVDHFG